jgi:hypothetical protein
MLLTALSPQVPVPDESVYIQVYCLRSPRVRTGGDIDHSGGPRGGYAAPLAQRFHTIPVGVDVKAIKCWYLVELAREQL